MSISSLTPAPPAPQQPGNYTWVTNRGLRPQLVRVKPFFLLSSKSTDPYAFATNIAISVNSTRTYQFTAGPV